MFKTIIKLRQHTPIIHFQHDQEGATLRATEVKPKLDRFISQKLVSVRPALYREYETIIKKRFKVADKGVFGDYKMSIMGGEQEAFVVAGPIGRNEREKAEKYGVDILDSTAYFADAEHIRNGFREDRQTGEAPFQKGDFSKIKKGLLFENLSVSIFSFHTDLLKMLDKVIPVFLATFNFGSRQTKGFGCFTEENFTRADFENALQLDNSVVSVYEKQLPSNNLQNLVKTIQADYQLLKSGKNFNGYEKSLLWKYLCTPNRALSWEKKMVKEQIRDEFPQVWESLEFKGDYNRIEKCKHDPEENFHYIRALLGLGEQLEFKTRDRRDSVRVKISDVSKQVERLPSPITFKVFDSTIFLIARNPDPAIHTTSESRPREFDFELTARVNRRNYSRKLGKLTVPNNFDIGAFLDFALSEKSPIENYSKIK